jgi:hypothetical protein
LRPGVEVGAVRHRERKVIETYSRLVERFAVAVPVLREPEPGSQAVVTQEHFPPSTVGRGVLTGAPKAEHVLVPGGACIDIPHRQAKVVDVVDHPPTRSGGLRLR